MNVKVYSAWKLKLYLAAVTAICLALCCALPAHAQSDDQRPSQESVTQPNSLKLPSDQHYKPRTADESEFDNSHDPFAQHWQDSEPPYEYEDTEFGNLLYNEAISLTLATSTSFAFNCKLI